jgi:hypothetical protein
MLALWTNTCLLQLFIFFQLHWLCSDAVKCLTLGGKRGLVGASATTCVARVAMDRAGEPVLDDLMGPVIARDVLGVRVVGGCTACAWL